VLSKIQLKRKSKDVQDIGGLLIDVNDVNMDITLGQMENVKGIRSM
jgi:hypothetical protein